MPLSVELIFCSIFYLWINSISAESAIVNGNWPVEIKRCQNSGGGHRNFAYNVEKQLKLNVPFNALDEKTVVRVEGKIEVETASTDILILSELKLDKYVEGAFYKLYRGEVNVENFTANSGQIGYVGVTLKIDRFTSAIEFTNSAYAGSWRADKCSTAKSFLTKLEVIV